MIVAITGAGWDPVTEVKAKKRGADIAERTPEMFWRIGRGHTVLSRMVHQFRGLGAEQIFVGTGAPGCSPTVTEDAHAEVYGTVVANYGQSPWTKTQVEYIRNQKCIPVLMPDPHAKGKNCWSTLLQMAPQILAADWDHIVISAGDYVFRTSFLDHLVESAVWPSQFWFWIKHGMEFLTRDGFLKYTDWLRGLSHRSQGAVWLKRAEHGIPQTVWGTREGVLDWMAEDWNEVGAHSWRIILELVAEDPV